MHRQRCRAGTAASVLVVVVATLSLTCRLGAATTLSLPSCQRAAFVDDDAVEFRGITLPELDAPSLTLYLKHLWSTVDVIVESDSTHVSLSMQGDDVLYSVVDAVTAAVPAADGLKGLKSCQPLALRGRPAFVCAVSPYADVVFKARNLVNARVHCKPRMGTSRGGGCKWAGGRQGYEGVHPSLHVFSVETHPNCVAPG